MHNILRTQFWATFKEQQKGDKIVILTTPEKSKAYEEELKAENIVFESLTARPNKAAQILDALAANAINTHTVKWLQWNAVARKQASVLPTILKRIYSTIFGSSTLFKKLLRSFIVLYAEYGSEVPALFEKYKPSAVYTTSLTDPEFDIPVALEARRRNIRHLATIRSWDNLTSHGLLRVVPDKLFLQNQFLLDMADTHQALRKGVVHEKPYGLPHYDRYKDKNLLISREEFCAGLGLDPNKKIILYGAMGDFLFPNEGSIADLFEEIIEEGKINAPVQVLFRAHPAFQSPLENMKKLQHVTGDRGGTYLDNRIKSFEMKNTDMAHLINSFHHADVATTAGSTMAIDAAALNRPTICIAFDGTAQNVKPYLSVRRFYDTYTHFEAFMRTGSAAKANTKEELAEMINQYLKNPEKDAQGRESAVAYFVAPFNGNSGSLLAEMISNNLE